MLSARSFGLYGATTSTGTLSQSSGHSSSEHSRLTLKLVVISFVLCGIGSLTNRIMEHLGATL